MVPYYEFQSSDIEIIHNARELRYNSHIHGHIEIVYVFKVGQHVHIDGKDYEVKEGEAAIIFPNLVHSYYRNEYRDTDQLLLICSPALFKGLFPNFDTHIPENPIITGLDNSTRLAFCELLNADEFPERLAWSLVILSKLMKKVKLSHTDSIPVENLTQKIVHYIAQNFTEEITLDSLAKEFNVSKYYISHTFSKSIKITLPNYLSIIRAEYAAGMIRSTNESITNICNESGFSSQTTFNRAFKRIYRMTPREYKDSVGELYKQDSK